MSKINTNMAGVTTLYHLRNKEDGMNKALERISSGLRLNHAVDDAAGASIVNRMTSQIKGLEAAIRNAADAISLTQTAEGAIEEVTDILHRMRELSVQSANGVYTGQDRQAIQNEVGALQEELHRIAESSTFNGVKMLNGSFIDTTFQVGFQPNDTATLSIEDVKPTGLGEFVLKTDIVDSGNMIPTETTATTSTTSNNIVNSGTGTVTLNEGFYMTIAAPASSGSALDTFATTYPGGTYSTSTDGFSVDASTGLITSTSLKQYDATKTATEFPNTQTVTRVYTEGANIFTEEITLTLTDVNPNTITRSATSTISVNSVDDITINAFDTGTTQATATQGSLSAELAAFIQGSRTVSGNNGTFSLSGTDAAQFAVDSATGQITWASSPTLLNTDKSLVLTFTSDVGDVFTETIVIDHDSSNPSIGEITLNVSAGGAPSTVNYDLTSAANFSSALNGVYSTASTTITGLPTGITFDNTNDNLVFDLNDSALGAGTTVSFDMVLDNGSGTVHTEQVSFTVAGSQPADAVARATDVSPGSFTVPNSSSVTSNNTGIEGPAYTSGAGTPSYTDGTNGQINTAISMAEGAQIVISTDAQSTNLKNFVTANAGGSFSISGTDAALFNVDTTTGQITSKAHVDYETPDDDGLDRTYNVSLKYTQGTNNFTDIITVTITDDTSDNTANQAAGKPRLGTDRTTAASLINEDEDITIYGNVGTKVIDVNGKSSAYEVVQAINAEQSETGVYADAQTRVNISFPEQIDLKTDTVTFSLMGVNETAITVSGNVDFGQTNGRDANIRQLANAVNSVSGKTGITAKVSSKGDTLHMFSNEGHDIVVENFTMSVLDIAMNVSSADDNLVSVGDVQQLRKGVGNNDTFRSTGQITFHSPYIFSVDAGLTGINGGGLFQTVPGAATLSSVSSLDVLTVEGAKKMLTAVDGALVRIDLERSDLGAVMSRMQHTINNLSNVVVNTKAARSRIQDADIAAETTEMTKAQVLSQAAQAMLAQANRSSQSILSLLQG